MLLWGQNLLAAQGFALFLDCLFSSRFSLIGIVLAREDISFAELKQKRKEISAEGVTNSTPQDSV